MLRRALSVLITGLMVLGISLVVIPQAPVYAHQPSTPTPPTPDALPSSTPSAITPQVDDGEVWSAAAVGNLMVIGGNFTSVGGQSRSGLAAFNATTGALTSFAPTLAGGQVFSVMPGPNDHSVYVGGTFTTVNGGGQKYLALLDTATSAPVAGFTAPTFNFGGIRDLAKAGTHLIAGGFFTTANNQARQGLASMSLTTGALDTYLTVQLAGHHNDTGNGAQGSIGPWALDVSPDGTHLAVTGNFKTANGLLRDQLAMIDLTSSSAALDADWATNRYSPYCFNFAFDGYTRGVTFSPDSSYFVVNATGGGVPGTLCDATTRFETNSSGLDIQPTWVDETGGDTVWGVTVTNNAVYIGGHNRWNNNPLGSDQALPGAVPRPGFAALDPASGRPYSWNPGHKPLGKAVYAILATDKGVWMGYDFDYVGNFQYTRKKIAFFPYAGGYNAASTTTPVLPGTVYTGSLSSNGPTNVLYRVDAGGPAIESSDGGPSWTEDTGGNPSQYRNQQSNVADYGPVNGVTADVPASTPRAIFDHELWSPTDNPTQQWDFPVAAGTHVAVRLYFANRCSCTSTVGARKFDVNLEGNTVLNDYDIVADAGDQTGTMKSFDVTSDGDINIELSHVTENPLINGIEIINKDVAAPPPPTDTLSSIGFDGTTATAKQTVSGTSIPWASTRGAFVVGNKLFYGSTDGMLYTAPVNGSTIGNPTPVNPYHDPAWANVQSGNGTTFDGNFPQLYSQMPNVTGMFYSAGKLYFTLAGDSALHWAWFSPDSGIVDQTQSTATSSVDFSDADGMFVSNGTLYFARKSNGSLYKADFSGGAVSGSATLIDGPSTGGQDWTNKSLFFLGSPPGNAAPKAAFSFTCAAGGCSVDGSGSTDSDGSIVSYAWTFGDGGTATGVNPSHTYNSSGTYDVTLTVTDNKGAKNSVTHQVTVTATASQITFVGANHSESGATTSKTVNVPSGMAVGDTMLAVLTTPTGQGWSSPGAGWTQVSTLTNVSIVSTMWVKTATAADLGTPVKITNGTTYAKAILSVAVYHGAAASNPIDTFERSADAGGFSHSTPNVNASAGDTVVSFWTDKSAAVNQWTVPAGVAKRDDGYGTGTSGRMSVLVGDSNGPVAAGTYGALTATTDTSSDKAIMWTVALRPAAGGGSNTKPTAAFSSSCSGLTCGFDASTSNDTEGPIASYAWDFGDSSNGTGKTPSHTYAAGTYNVTLTVTDSGGLTDSITKSVTVSAATNPISYVGTSHSGPGATTSKVVAIPAAANVGDTMVLVFTGSGTTWTSPGAGWTQVSTLTNVSIYSTMWTKQVAAGEPGSNVTVTNGGNYAKASLTLGVYRGVSASTPVSAFARAGDSGGKSHTTPTVAAAAGDLVASFWTDKSAGVGAWTAPASVTKRSDYYDTGSSGRFSALFADSGAPVAAGTYGGLAATTDTASDKAIMWTVALKSAN